MLEKPVWNSLIFIFLASVSASPAHPFLVLQEQSFLESPCFGWNLKVPHSDFYLNGSLDFFCLGWLTAPNTHRSLCLLHSPTHGLKIAISCSQNVSWWLLQFYFPHKFFPLLFFPWSNWDHSEFPCFFLVVAFFSVFHLVLWSEAYQFISLWVKFLRFNGWRGCHRLYVIWNLS